MFEGREFEMESVRGLLEKLVFFVLTVYFVSKVAQSVGRLQERKIGTVTSR